MKKRTPGKTPRTKSTSDKTRKNQGRRSKHIDSSREIPGLNEEDLYVLLDNLAEPPFILILDGVQDPHNLGACLRTAAAAGIHAVVAPRDRSVGLTETARRISSGGAETVPFMQVTNLSRMIKELKEMGIWLVGTAHDADREIYDIDLSGPLAIVMGSEGFGMRRLTREGCDFVARIPMPGKFDNLNVSVAAGVTIFEAVRQRSIKNKKIYGN